MDVSATVSVGLAGGSLSGSVGTGKATGKTDWVEQQTSITAKDKLDIRTENHTQLDGALIASDSGNLKLDTNTLGFRDIEGVDKEHNYYINVGGSWGWSGGDSKAATANTITTDGSMEGRGERGGTAWSVSGYNYEKDREQIVRATVGAGDIVVRNDAQTGQDSSAGLNRDINKAYEVTKDHEEQTDLYISKSSLEGVAHPTETAERWGNELQYYDQAAIANFDQAGALISGTLNQLDTLLHPGLPASAVKAGGEEIVGQALDALIAAGYSRQEARDILSNPQVRNGVLAELKKINDLKPADLEQAQNGLIAAGIDLAGAIELAPTDVNAEGPTVQQQVLDKAVKINNYLQEHPDQINAVNIILAAAQGPKGVITYALNEVLSGSPLGEKFVELNNLAGQRLAEEIEGRPLDPANPGERQLIGGGVLMAGFLLGIVGDKAAGRVVGVKGNNSLLLPGNQTVAQFEKGLSYLPPGERVAQIKSVASVITAANGMVKDNKLSKLNGRDVYKGKDGNLYALDTQHGRFEVVSSKSGKHLGEVDFGLSQTKLPDRSGGHDLRVR
nr:adhesin [Pseudomonas sp. LS1212]